MKALINKITTTTAGLDTLPLRVGAGSLSVDRLLQTRVAK